MGIARFGITGVLNLIFGLIFWKSGDRDDTIPENLQTHLGALTFVSISAMFGGAQGTLLSFPFEKPVFLREYSTGTYSVTAYTLSKILTEIPLAFLQNLWVMTIAYNMIGFQGNFLYHVFALFLLGLTASTVAMIISAVAKDLKQATETVPALFVPQLLFAGFFIRIDQIPVYLRWAQYLCSLKYTLSISILVEFGEQTCDWQKIPGCKSILSSNNVDKKDWWIYCLVLLALFLVGRTFVIVVLTRAARKFF